MIEMILTHSLTDKYTSSPILIDSLSHHDNDNKHFVSILQKHVVANHFQ